MTLHALLSAAALLFGLAAASEGPEVEACAAGSGEDCEALVLLQSRSSRRHDDTDDWSMLQAAQLTINSPQDMIKALLGITAGNASQKKLLCESANRSVVVADGLFGSVGFEGPNLDGRGVNFADPVPPTTAVAMVFWSPGAVFPDIIKSCCSTDCGGMCACAILDLVGIETKGKTFASQRYLVVEGVEVNETAKPIEKSSPFAAKKPINTISPTWANLAKFTPSTFDDVFTKSGIDWTQKCTSGEISQSVVSTLENFTLGCGNGCNENNTGTEGTIFQFIKEFPNMTSLYNISCPVEKDCSSCTDQHDGEPSAQEFFDSIPGSDGLCSDVATVRAYMYYYFDANAFFCGSGRDPGGPEDITIPNLLINEAGGNSAQIQLFEGSYKCPA